MCCQKLNEVDRARDYFVWANRWFELSPIKKLLTDEQLSELDAFRVEANALLGLSEQTKE
jgi:hypothetical protein